jgi:hypothetical protein
MDSSVIAIIEKQSLFVWQFLRNGAGRLPRPYRARNDKFYKVGRYNVIAMTGFSPPCGHYRRQLVL